MCCSGLSVVWPDFVPIYYTAHMPLQSLGKGCCWCNNRLLHTISKNLMFLLCKKVILIIIFRSGMLCVFKTNIKTCPIFAFRFNLIFSSSSLKKSGPAEIRLSLYIDGHQWTVLITAQDAENECESASKDNRWMLKVESRKLNTTTVSHHLNICYFPFVKIHTHLYLV